MFYPHYARGGLFYPRYARVKQLYPPPYVREKQLSSSGFSLAAIKIPGEGNLYSILKVQASVRELIENTKIFFKLQSRKKW